MQSRRSWFHRILVLFVCAGLLNLSTPLPRTIAQSNPDTAEDIYLPWIANKANTSATPEQPGGNSQDSLYLPLIAKNSQFLPVTPTPAPTSTPPPSGNSGWVSGVIYDSAACDVHLTQCKPLAGVRITVASVDTIRLAQLRAARRAEIVASGYSRPLAPLKNANVTTPIPGEVTTDSNGAFHFPIAETGAYWLRAEKDGYTYAQREFDIIAGRSTATNAVYLTPLDSAVTNCSATGCKHTNSDGSMQLDIPAGAIPQGETVKVTTTNFKQVEFLPSGDLPEGTWETYAFNLGGDSEYVFQPGTSATVRVRNDKGFAVGTSVPLGYWNQATQAWEHAGTGIVDASGQWVEIGVTHFSNYDCNDPLGPGGPGGGSGGDGPGNGGGGPGGGGNGGPGGPGGGGPGGPGGGSGGGDGGSGGGDQGSGNNGEQKEPEENSDCDGCTIHISSGILEEEIALPPVRVLGEQVAPTLVYRTTRAHPSQVIDIPLELKPDQGIQFLTNYVNFELYIEGKKTDNFTFAANLQAGEIGRYRYLWDGRDAQGRLLSPGVYRYTVKIAVPYRAQYCYSLNGIFGNPPDCLNGATGIFTTATQEVYFEGTVKLDAQPQSSYGSGWVLQGQQRLYQDAAGRILIADGARVDEFEDINRVQARLSLEEAHQLAAAVALSPTIPSSVTQDVTTPEIHHAATMPETRENPLPAAEGAAESANDLPPTPTVEEIVTTDNTPDTLQPYLQTPNATQTDVCGVIATDTIWRVANNPYVMTCDVTVQAGATLTLEPGVIVKGDGFLEDLHVYGTLIANGTAAQPIVFTSIHDDTYGGDTNQNGNATSPAANNWEGIYFHAGSQFTGFSHVELAYSSYGLDLNGADTGINLTFANNHFHHNLLQALQLELAAAGGQVTVRNNTATNNGINGVQIRGTISNALTLDWQAQNNFALNMVGDLIVGKSGALTLSPNTVLKAGILDDIHVYGNLIANSTVAQPVVFTALRDDSHAGDTNNNGSATLPEVGEWEGIKFYPGSQFTGFSYVEFAYSSYGLDLNGADTGINLTFANNHFHHNFLQALRLNLNAAGGQITARDNLIGEDGDNAALIGGSITNTFNLDWSGQTNWAIDMLGGFTVHPNGLLQIAPNTILKGSALDNIEVYGGLIVEGTAEKPIIFTSIRDDNYAGDTNRDGTATTPATRDWPGFTLHHTTTQPRSMRNALIAYGRNGLYFEAAGAGLNVNVENSTFKYIDNAPIYFELNEASGQILAQGNKATNNDLDTIGMEGTVAGILNLQTGGPSAMPINLYNDITVGRTGTLIIAPGTIFKGSNPSFSDDIQVFGTLIARGTAKEPIVFTSIKDNRYGDINRDGVPPAPYDWGSVRFHPSSRGNVLQNCIVAYGYRNLWIESNEVAVTGCTIQYSKDAGIYVTGNTAPQRIFGNQFDHNTPFALRNAGTVTVTATYNSWGDASGPYHPTLNPNGKGDPVSDRVAFKPWGTGATLDLPALIENDYTVLRYNPADNTYTRLYPSGHQVHFNVDGRHDYTQDPDGHRWSYSYHADGSVADLAFTLVGESSPRYRWAFQYNGGKLATITDPAGQITRFTLNTEGNLTQVDFANSTNRRFRYDANGLLIQRWDEDSNSWQYGYDAYGRINRHTAPSRQVYNYATGTTEERAEERSFTPNETGYPLINDSAVGNPDSPAPAAPKAADLIAKVKFGRGQLSGRMNRWGAWQDLTDAIGRTITFERDDANRITRRTEPDGDCVEFTYDDRGNRLSSRAMDRAQCVQSAAAASITNSTQNWSYTYEDRFNQLKTKTDPLGQTTTYIYDYEEGVSAAGRLIRIHYPAVQATAGAIITPTVRYSYNALGLVETMTDEAGIVTRYSYNDAGLLTQIVENVGGLNLATAFQDFDAAGRPQTIIAPRNNTWRYTYDLWGRPLTVTDPLGVLTNYEYDGRGNLLRSTIDQNATPTAGRNLVTTYRYDVDDRLLNQQTTGDNLTQSQTFVYDINGNLATYSDSEGQITRFAYDDANQLTQIQNPLNQSTRFTYTLKGELAQITQANDKTIRFGYDAFGNLTSLTPPDRPAHDFGYSLRNETAVYSPPDAGSGATQTSYSYNALGQLASMTRPDSQVIAYVYDNAQRLQSVAQPRGLTTYSYNAATNQLTGITAPGNSNLSYGYDNELLTNVTWSGSLNGSVTYGYDNFYRLTALAVNGANTINYQYDNNSFVTQAGDLAIKRLHQSRLLDTTTLGQVNDRYEYDSFGKLTHYQANVGATLLYDLRYTYDDLDRIATQAETLNGQTTTYAYSYDAVGQLSEVKANGVSIATYSYDGNGNRLSGPGGATGSYDNQDRLLSYGDATYSYTANGELRTKTQGSQTTTYNYDAFSNLMAVTLPNGIQIDYLVDGQDRRIGKRVNGVLVQGWLYGDQLEPVVELDGSGNVVSRFVYGTHAHTPDFMLKGGVTYRLVSDHLGSIHLVVNTQTGAIAQQLNYDEFGRVIQDTNPGFQPFGFAGGLYDRDTGLVRFGARDYDPETGRWTTKDPIEFEGGDANLYAYTLNDPVNLIDPEGLVIWGVVGGAAIGAAIDLGGQLINNGGNIDCIDWKSVGMSALEGGVLGGLGRGFQLGKTVKSGKGLQPRTASEWERWAQSQGFKKVQSGNGPIKYVDKNGIERVTLKQGSSRTAGSEKPHVSLRNEGGQRVDTAGNPVSRRSPGNHTPIDWDLH